MDRRTFESLDGLRGIAAIVVFSVHTPGQSLARFAPSAYLAVDLFFLLSGFVLAHAYGDRLRSGELGLGRYAVLRLIRMYPLYILGVLLGLSSALLAAPLGMEALHGLDGWGRALLMNLAFLPAWGAGQEALYPASRTVEYALYPFDFPLWSLFWELVISLAFGLVMALRLGRGTLLLALAAGLALMIQVPLQFGSLNEGDVFPSFWAGLGRVLFPFSMGVALYHVWRSGRVPAFSLPIWVVAPLFLAILMIAPSEHRTAYDLAASTVVFPILLLASTAPPPAFLVRPFTLIGATSYPFYVLHVPAMLWIDQVAAKVAGRHLTDLPALGLAALGGVIFLAAMVVERLYDVPVRRALTRLARGRRAAPPVAAPARTAA